MRHRDKKAAEEAMLGSAQGMPAPTGDGPAAISDDLSAALVALAEAGLAQWRSHRPEAETEVVVEVQVSVLHNGKAFGKAFGAGWRKTTEQPPADHQPVGEVRRG